MDAYEATRIVLKRIQSLDPENAAKIMGLLLLQDHGEKEMIRLAFGPEALLCSVILEARKELGLSPPASRSPHVLGNPKSPSGVFRVTTPVFSPRTSSLVDGSSAIDEEEALVSPGNRATASPFYGVGSRNIPVGPRSSLFDPEMSGHRRSCSAVSAELFLDSEAAGLVWKPCMYFARGFCKSGGSCRFVHGSPDEVEVAAEKMDGVAEQQCEEVLLNSRSPRQLTASAFPFSPIGSVPVSPSGNRNSISFMLQQRNESRRAAVAAAAAMMLEGDEAHKFITRSRMMERDEFSCGFADPAARQIYLTFPADSTFSDDDVSTYFSIYGPVQDVRIPYQQKRMFGFVTFFYPETVKLILAKGNPHFVCDARVLVKPYKEKGKVPEKYRKQQQQHSESADFSACSTPTGLEDSRDAFELQQLGSRMLYGTDINREMLLKRKLEEQKQAAELQHVIELQRRRFMGLRLLDLKNRSLYSSFTSPTIPFPTIAVANENDNGKASAITTAGAPAAVTELQLSFPHQCAVNATGADDNQESFNSELTSKEEMSFRESTVEHNLPESPFESPTKASSLLRGNRALSILLPTDESLVASAASPCTNNGSSYYNSMSDNYIADMPSFNSCLFQMPRFPSDHCDAGNVNDGVNTKQLLSPVQGAVSMQ